MTSALFRVRLPDGTRRLAWGSVGAGPRSLADPSASVDRALSFPVGAVVLTGTGVIPEPAFTLRPGDVVRIEVDGIGTLENPVAEVGNAPRGGGT